MQETLSQYSPKELARWRGLSIAFAVLAFCIGAAAFLGWILSNEFLTRIHPSLVAMKGNTTVCLMLVAIAVLLNHGSRTTTLVRRISRVCAAIVALVGLLTLSEHIVGWDARIDQLLFVETPAQAGLSIAGRMGIAASLNFVLLGIGLALIDTQSKRWFRVSNIAVLTVVAITLLVFLHYFYGIESFEPIAPYLTIALHTVVAFLSLCAAILLARPERGLIAMFLGNTSGAVVARRMCPVLSIVILLGWIRTNARSDGWFSAGFATAAFVLAILVLLAGLIRSEERRVGKECRCGLAVYRERVQWRASLLHGERGRRVRA